MGISMIGPLRLSPFVVTLVMFCLTNSTFSEEAPPIPSPTTQAPPLAPPSSQSQALPTTESPPPSTSCSASSYTVVHCALRNVVRGRSLVEVDVVVNQCNEPVDMTFFVRSTDYHVNFTYVPNNQNERILLPRLHLEEPAHIAPTYLYIREPLEEFDSRNGSTSDTNITVLASLVSVYRGTWEEEEFLTHSFPLQEERSRGCPSWGRLGHPVLLMWVQKVVLLAVIPPSLVALLSYLAIRYKVVKKAMNLCRKNTNDSANNGSSSVGSTASNNNSLNKVSSQLNTQPEAASQPSAVAASLKKFKQNIEVSIKANLPFKKLQEDADPRNNIEFKNVVKDGGSVTTANPSFLSTGGQQSSQPKEVKVDVESEKEKGRFEYGSRDYLDQLEGSSTSPGGAGVPIPPEERAWQEKFEESDEESSTMPKVTFAKCNVKPKEKTDVDSPAKSAVSDALQKGYFSYDFKE